MKTSSAAETTEFHTKVSLHWDQLTLTEPKWKASHALYEILRRETHFIQFLLYPTVAIETVKIDVYVHRT